MLSPNFIRAAKIEPFPLDKPIGIQLAITGSKSVINYGANATINYEGRELKEYFNIINIDYYDTILGTPFLRKHEVIINFINSCLRLKDKIIHNQANEYKVGEGNPQKNKKNVSMKALKQEEPVGDPSKIRPYSSLTGLLLSLFSLTAFSSRKPKNKRKAE